MPEPEIIDIRRLASLLDDPDEGVAISAMAELLNRESELGEIPAELQESSSPLMRRRIHQLQSALTMIQRRRYLNHLLEAENINFLDGLLQIHLQWFDRDSEVTLQRRLKGFRSELQRHSSGDLREIGNAFAVCGVTAAPLTTLKVEQYCLGTMLDDKCGAAPLWCGMICHMYRDKKLQTVRYQGRFAVISDSEILIPENNWQTSPLPPTEELESWPLKNLLHLTAVTLFSAAVNSDSFRYILTISQALTGSSSGEALSLLPYPYNPELSPEG